MSSNIYRNIDEKIAEVVKKYNILKERKKKDDSLIKLPSIRTLAKNNQLPYQRLLRKINGGNSRSTRARTNERLDKAQYEALFIYIERLDAAGVPPTPEMVRIAANEILERNHQDSATKPPTVGKDWAYRFIKKHPQYNKRKLKAIDPKRTDAERISDIRRWYGELDVTIEAWGIQDEDIYNMDETGFQIGQGRDENVITQSSVDGKISSSFTRTLVTVIESIGVSGHVLPPFIIMPGKRHMVNWLVYLFHEDSYSNLIDYSM